MANVKIIQIFAILLFPIIAEAQFYNRLTNNNVNYNDSTAKVAIGALSDSLHQGKSFTDLAFKYSQDPGSYKQGGELKPNTMEGFVKEYKKAVFKLNPGETSLPFRSEFGYHIVQLVSRKDNVFVTRHILLRVDP
ncbi:peptidylprolyl isomerase [Spirosoma sp. KUDC1026]|uniref:peptidylprolyl isomerase n=1 Tax=Spirosoma sp. KUDC1026 TaxID=2745947 RepID=UPI00159BB291|nr:peptidylprolyl isomerase [Spirosoma sp. KUDC1026]QKZ11869.1 peptidylprolyl isomerase [Spirosoma sp. KUDC1026]